MSVNLDHVLPFLVIGLAPKNRIWAAFSVQGDAHAFSRLVPYGRVVTLEEYVDATSKQKS